MSSGVHSLPARLLLASTGVHVVLWLAGPWVRSLAPVALVELVASVVIVGTVVYLLISWLARLNRQLLWRIRRKLIVSYILIGLIPVILIVTMFVLAGTLSLLSVSSFMVKVELDDLVEDASTVARVAAAELAERSTADALGVLRRHRRGVEAQGTTASVALVPTAAGRFVPVSAGAWAGGMPPHDPDWLVGNTFDGLVGVPTAGGLRLVARAARPAGVASVVIVDLPVDTRVVQRIRVSTGAELQGASVVALDGSDRRDPLLETEPVVMVPAPKSPSVVSSDGLGWFTFLEFADWETGARRLLTLQIRVSPAAYYQRIFGAQARIGDVSLGYALLVALVAIGGLFLVIEFAAFVMGLALAKSITGSVHALFIGTQQVQRGDLTHRIQVRTRDQLGELATSFNAMTASVRNLLDQAAARKRLEEELRIARDVQMSLLPREPESVPGLDLAAVCRPAREVGGDYYDFIPLGDRQLGVLVADVSGKGTSAAFYMAELKGVVLSLSQVHRSPRALLCEVNRIMTRTIDSRSFVTMTYAVIDLDRAMLTYARAGHTPLIHATTRDHAAKTDVLAPSGLVVGLDGFEREFDELLVEETRPVGTGDVIVLFTDGVTEAMNEREEFFGEDRLTARVLDAHDQHPEAIQARVLEDVHTFVGGADQHDDMTIVVLKVGAEG